MIGLLTTKELDFLTKLAELLKEYSAIISYGHCSELRILVCAGDSEDVEKYPIIFEDSFDENEIYDLLRKNRKRIEEIKAAIRQMGNINVNAIEDYKEMSQRHGFLQNQHDDLIKAEKALEEIIGRPFSLKIVRNMKCVQRHNMEKDTASPVCILMCCHMVLRKGRDL